MMTWIELALRIQYLRKCIGIRENFLAIRALSPGRYIPHDPNQTRQSVPSRQLPWAALPDSGQNGNAATIPHFGE